MQNRIVATIAQLAAMLGETQENYELTALAADAALEASTELSLKCDRLEEDLSNARVETEQVRHLLSEERRANNTTESWAQQTHARCFRDFMRSPETFYTTYMKGIAFMRSAEGQSMMHNKIAQIKRLREITGYGLKEAKDLCEAFHAYPSVTPDAAPLPDPSATLANPPAPTAQATAE